MGYPQEDRAERFKLQCGVSDFIPLELWRSWKLHLEFWNKKCEYSSMSKRRQVIPWIKPTRV